MTIAEVLPRIDCPLPNVVVMSIVAAAVAIAGFLVWLSVVHVRGKSLPQVRLVAALGIVVILTMWAGQLAASEPVLVSGMLNRGIALGLVVISLCVSLLGAGVRKGEPTLAALLFTCGGAIVFGAMLGWTWRSQQPCKHTTVRERAETQARRSALADTVAAGDLKRAEDVGRFVENSANALTLHSHTPSMRRRWAMRRPLPWALLENGSVRQLRLVSCITPAPGSELEVARL